MHESEDATFIGISPTIFSAISVEEKPTPSLEINKVNVLSTKSPDFLCVVRCGKGDLISSLQ